MNINLEPAPSGLSSENNLYMAKVAEAADRFDEMKEYMNACVAEKDGNDLTVEERNLISVAYKNIMSALRTAHRVATGSKDDQLEEAEQAKYKEQIASELKALIHEVTEKVVAKFTKGPLATTLDEMLVFFHKMEGDYYRYGAEICSGEEKAKFGEQAREAYQRASDKAEEGDGLKPTNPIRLGLALNFSVFFYEILEEHGKAQDLAQAAFDRAIDQLDTLEEEEYRDSTLIMQLLKDNLSLWGDNAEDDN